MFRRCERSPNQPTLRYPVTNALTQAAEIDRTINREHTFASLCVALCGTNSYNVAREVSEIRIRMALGVQNGAVLRTATILAGYLPPGPASRLTTRLSRKNSVTEQENFLSPIATATYPTHPLQKLAPASE